MRCIIHFAALLCLVFGTPAICCCQISIAPQHDGGHIKSYRASGQALDQNDANARSVGSAPASAKSSVTVTGILLVDDWRCDEWPADVPKDTLMCPKDSSQWGLITTEKQYSVWGETSELKKYERQRVTVTGKVTAAGNPPVDRLEVESIVSSEIDESQIRGWIEQLRSYRWSKPRNVANPTVWEFHLTPPMIRILQAGPAAQSILLEYIDDPEIQAQIIFLLGGVGNGEAIEPIINAMARADDAQESEYARKINLAANLALTNIAVSDVIWHHGGGVTVDGCPDDPKSCWSAWWREHSATFDISHTPNRRYSNYPDYGIYQDPGLFRSENFIHNATDK